MGEMADLLINGDDCEVCGMPFETPGDGFPRKCDSCRDDERKERRTKRGKRS